MKAPVTGRDGGVLLACSAGRTALPVLLPVLLAVLLPVRLLVGRRRRLLRWPERAARRRAGPRAGWARAAGCRSCEGIYAGGSVSACNPAPGRTVDNLYGMSLPAAPYGRMLTAMARRSPTTVRSTSRAPHAIANHLVEHGNDGVVVSGTTGESPTTTVPEDTEILRAVKDAVGDRCDGDRRRRHQLHRPLRRARPPGREGRRRRGPAGDAVLQQARPRPASLHHFTEVATATNLPVMLYDVPGRTGQAIALETYEQAARLDTVTSVKHATGNPARHDRAARARLRRLLRRRRAAASATSPTAAAASSRWSATPPATSSAR